MAWLSYLEQFILSKQLVQRFAAFSWHEYNLLSVIVDKSALLSEMMHFKELITRDDS